MLDARLWQTEVRKAFLEVVSNFHDRVRLSIFPLILAQYLCTTNISSVYPMNHVLLPVYAMIESRIELVVFPKPVIADNWNMYISVCGGYRF